MTTSVTQLPRPTLDELVEDVIATANWLDEHNGASREELGLRIMKVLEEAGDAVRAWLGVTGQDPRRGFSHTHADVAAELADTAFAALVAIESLNGDAAVELIRCAKKARRQA